MRLDTEEIRKILSNVHVYGRSSDPRGSWSPDGTRFALAAANVRGLRGGAGIVLLDREGNVVGQHMKTGWFDYDGTLGWLDGRTLVLSKFYNPLGGGLADDPGGIYLLDVDSGEERQIVRNVEIVIDPDDPPW
ncbi:MAG: hypothetical protein JSU98_16430 [Gemmatimonadales bacterium]|jgi:hypothetical protein|nr:MAG: hypothetical protein JSU98_16430 [Gemmatimonadales bacterium]